MELFSWFKAYHITFRRKFPEPTKEVWTARYLSQVRVTFFQRCRLGRSLQRTFPSLQGLAINAFGKRHFWQQTYHLFSMIYVQQLLSTLLKTKQLLRRLLPNLTADHFSFVHNTFQIFTVTFKTFTYTVQTFSFALKKFTVYVDFD